MSNSVSETDSEHVDLASEYVVAMSKEDTILAQNELILKELATILGKIARFEAAFEEMTNNVSSNPLAKMFLGKITK